MRILIRVVLASLVALALPAGTAANTMYTYEGDAFFKATGVYTLSDRIMGNFVLADSFVGVQVTGAQNVMAGVVSYNFTDGHQTFTEANSTALIQVPWSFSQMAPVLPDPGPGQNFWWQLWIESPTGFIDSYHLTDRHDRAGFGADVGYNCSSFGCFIAGEDTGGLSSHIGTWTAQTIPEPTTLALLTTALIGVGAGVWRRQRMGAVR